MSDPEQGLSGGYHRMTMEDILRFIEYTRSFNDMQ